MHVMRQIHGALRPSGLMLDVHPVGMDFAVRAGERGLGFVDTRKFAHVLAAMNECVQEVVDPGVTAGPLTETPVEFIDTIRYRLFRRGP